MTPEPTDLLRGARRTLEEILLPALDDAFAIEQAKTILRILVHLEGVVDDAYPLEWEEARDLATFLREPTPDVVNGELPSFRELRQANVRRKATLADLIRAGGATAATPPHPLRDLSPKGEVGELLRRQLDRDRRWTNPRTKPAKT